MSYTPDESKISATLLGRFLTGECTAEEAGRVRVWVASAPVAAEVVELLAGYRANRVVPEQMVDVEALWQGIQSRVLGDEQAGQDMSRRVFPQRQTTAVADPVVHRLSLESGVLTRAKAARPALQGIEPLGTQPLRRLGWSIAIAFIIGAALTAANLHILGHRNGVSMLTYATGNGQRATITLPDGATVALNVASRLEVPLGYMTGNRTVRLIGEGIFTVPHQTGTSLTVVAGTAAARVLGTSFLVRRYATDTATMIAVRDGKVAVGAHVVTAAQMVVAGPHGVSSILPSDGSQFTFASGILTIDGIPLRDAIPELERWYDVKIQLVDSTMAAHPLDGELAAGSVSDLSTLLEMAYKVRVVRAGRVLTLYPRS
ncbi:MAG TPA: FecR domain-containing protein [Gemmatimonadaceae bacterium]|jgi:ferric-dicitrate binding protein FerR (iron transport regulator)|nr:FecR domain-containing protein [Gemmatimonadaceae bacterium]